MEKGDGARIPRFNVRFPGGRQTLGLPPAVRCVSVCGCDSSLLRCKPQRNLNGKKSVCTHVVRANVFEQNARVWRSRLSQCKLCVLLLRLTVQKNKQTKICKAPAPRLPARHVSTGPLRLGSYGRARRASAGRWPHCTRRTAAG